MGTIIVQELQDIYRLQALVTIIKEGSFSSAAQKLHITQPALSSRLKLLEESLGCALLERSGRGVRATSMGKLVQVIALDILQKMEELLTTVRNHLELREGYVHLGGGATAVSGVYPRAISEFRHFYPNIQFTLLEKDSTSIIQALQNGTIDVGLVTKNPFISSSENPLKSLTVHGEIIDNLQVIAPIEHRLSKMQVELEKQSKELLPVHLNRQPMIMFEQGSAISEIIDLEFKRIGIKYRTIMTLRSTQSMIKMVEKNIGLSVVSEHSLQNEKSIQILKIQNLKMQRKILICSSAEKELTPSALEFTKMIKSLYATKVV